MKEKVFFAGTDDVKFIFEKLYDAFLEFGFKAIWFHREFPIDSKDTMEECLENVKKSDRLILVVDKRYGLPSRDSSYSISEEKFLTAYNDDKPILVFVNSETYIQSKMYHKIKKRNEEIYQKNLDELGFKAQKEIYEFIERTNIK